jgi:hypothetical protein
LQAAALLPAIRTLVVRVPAGGRAFTVIPLALSSITPIVIAFMPIAFMPAVVTFIAAVIAAVVALLAVVAFIAAVVALPAVIPLFAVVALLMVVAFMPALVAVMLTGVASMPAVVAFIVRGLAGGWAARRWGFTFLLLRRTRLTRRPVPGMTDDALTIGANVSPFCTADFFYGGRVR